MQSSTSPNKKITFFKRLTDKLVALASTRYAIYALALVSLIDASIFPVPPFAILIPMVLARPHNAWKYASIGVLSSFLGGILGYLLGQAISHGLVNAFQFDPNVALHFKFLSYEINTTLRQLLSENMLFLILGCSILPTPFKLIAIGSGMVGVYLPTFLIGALIGRCLRFCIVTLLLLMFGEGAKKFV